MTESAELDKELYGAAIGVDKTSYYLPKFERFARNGSLVSWNWPAFFLSFFWLLYRKMWLWATLYLLLPWPVFLLIGFISAFTTHWLFICGYIAYYIGIWLILPMYANALYFGHVREKVVQASSSIKAPERLIGYLAGQGGTSGGAAAVAAVFMSVSWAGMLAAIAIPQYQDYVMRARVAGIYQATLPVRESLEGILTYDHSNTNAIPVLDIAENVQAGEDSATLRYDFAKNILWVGFETDILAGKQLKLVPYLTEDNQIVWECQSEDLEEAWLPAGCTGTRFDSSESSGK